MTPTMLSARSATPSSRRSRAHARNIAPLRAPEWDGRAWEGVDTGEPYDLVVVGGGISGLSAAYFYRKAMGNDARILVIDNHDDFGGHAKRNEFVHEGRHFHRLDRKAALR